MTPQEFIAIWKKSKLTERSACQSHFLDLCELLGQPKPVHADPEGAWYTFERGVSKTVGHKGWADVWMKDHFGWEYKGKHKDLKAAYDQLLQYREDLENPPLLVVCDMDRFEIHTNFTGTVKHVYTFDLDDLDQPENLAVLRKLFTEPKALKPGQTSESITQQAAELFGQISDGMRVRGVPAQDAAHFLMKFMFCMFAEDIDLLKNGLFSRVLKSAKADPPRIARYLGELFDAMCTGGDFWGEDVLHFNGGLFADSNIVELNPAEIKTIVLVNEFDWASVEPSIFGTLFERTLDPAKRSQIGAHYTSREDILTLLEPVMMTTLRLEWEGVKEKGDELYGKVVKEARKKKDAKRQRKETKTRRNFNNHIRSFAERLSHVKVLDPACGSGNFLYVALHLLMDLEKEIIRYASPKGLGLFPQVRPTQLLGIESNPYAHELAQVVIWIGYLQWMQDNGFPIPRNPVLEPIKTIRNGDAILDLSDPENPREPQWPEAEFIVGNPPFLGNRLFTSHFDNHYTKSLFNLYENRLGGRPDICCYWFEKARRQIEMGKCKRASLLATQGIRGGTNRKVLQRIKDTGDIFFAESDREWILDGAHVHISMVGFDDGGATERFLDGKLVNDINSNLTGTADITKARKLLENRSIGFQGAIKRGSFDLPEKNTITLMHTSGNPNRKPNSDVIVPYTNGMDITRRNRNVWIIDFGCDFPLVDAAKYVVPFEHIREHVQPERQRANQQKARDEWWVHWCPRPEMTDALSCVERFIATPRVAKHRLFVWLELPRHVDAQLIVFARSDDYFFGVLHSRLHEVWARAQGTQLRERESGFRYTPTTCFETFPFPKPTKKQKEAIAAEAKELDDLRNNWLNPPEWTREEILEFPGSEDGPWKRYLYDVDKNGIGTVRYPRTVPKDADREKKLKKRTLTNLYNEPPTWLDLAHKTLDEAVFAAYGWDSSMADEGILEALLELNLNST